MTGLIWTPEELADLRKECINRRADVTTREFCADYAALSSRVNLASGQTSATLTVTPVDDALVEGPETVIVTLTGFGLFELTRRQFALQWGEIQTEIEKEIKRRETA